MISFVIPIYNEEESIPELIKRLTAVMEGIDDDCEVILVNDGSRDKSLALLKQARSTDPRFRYISFSRNFGHQAALTAGLEHSRGDATIILDADLQDPPELSLEMIKRWKEGYHIVYGQRISRTGETWFKKLTAAAYYRLLKRLTCVDLPKDTGDFRLIDKRVLSAFLALQERNRFIRGLFAWVGFRQVAVPYHREKRHFGVTKYPFYKMVKFALDGIISMSTRPLHYVFVIGLMMAGVSLASGVAAICLKVSGAYTVRGWTSMVLIVSFTSGVQIAILGLLGEYIGRIVEEVKQRPIYLVEESSETDAAEAKYHSAS